MTGLLASTVQTHDETPQGIVIDDAVKDGLVLRGGVADHFRIHGSTEEFDHFFTGSAPHIDDVRAWRPGRREH